MKNRRIVIVAFMLVAALCLGIGYANISDTLTVGGTLSVDEAHFDEIFEAAVKFVDVSGAKPATKEVKSAGVYGAATPIAAPAVTAIVEGTGDDIGDIFTVSVANTVFTQEGDRVKIYVNVQNDTAQTAVEVVIADDVAPELSMFTITMEAEDGDNKIAASDVETYVITITLDAIPAKTVTNATFTFTLTATPIN